MVGGEGSAFHDERRRLAAELKRLREAAGLTQRELASLLGVSQPKIAHLESAQRSARPEDVAAWGRAVGGSPAQLAELVARAERAQAEVVNWRRELQAVGGLAGVQREVADLERRATTVRIYHPLLIPGLLQTAEYARQVFLQSEQHADVGEAVRTRLDRQRILFEPGKRFEFVLHVGALRWRVGSTPVQAAQLDRIRQVATLSNVSLGIIPMDVQANVWRDHGLYMVDDVADADALVIVELLGRNVSFSDPAIIDTYREAFRRLQAVAATGREANAILDRAIKDLGGSE